MKTGANAEWHPLREVLVHPPGIEVFFALLSPRAHLYERFFDLGKAAREHETLCETLRSGFGVRVHILQDAIQEGAVRDPVLHDALAELADRRLGRRCRGETCALPRAVRREIEEPVPVAMRDPGHLFTMALLNPRLTLASSGVRVSLGHPLHNLYFMRDQQATTASGIIMGRMATPERSGEPLVASLALRALGASPAASICRGSFEGGDFIPLGDAALLGCGSRTDETGVAALLAAGPGCDEVAVVQEPHHPLINGYDPMVCMHLDTYCNIAAPNVAVGSPLLLRAAKVTVWIREGKTYRPSGEESDLEGYLISRGYTVLPLSTLEQLCYAANFLAIREGTCISPDTRSIAPVVLSALKEKARRLPGRYGKLLAQAEHEYGRQASSGEFFPDTPAVREHNLSMTPIELTNATGGYGGAHCMTCVLSRR